MKRTPISMDCRPGFSSRRHWTRLRRTRRLTFETIEQRRVFDATIFVPPEPSDFIVLGDLAAEVAPAILAPAIEEDGVQAPLQQEVIPPEVTLPDVVPPDDGLQPTTEDCEPVDAESDPDCPSANDSEFLNSETEDTESGRDSLGDVEATEDDSEPNSALRQGVMLLQVSPYERPVKSSVGSVEVNRDETALLRASWESTPVGDATSDDSIRYWSHRPAMPLDWSLRTEATRNGSPALSMITAEPEPVASSVAATVPNERDVSDERVDLDRSVPALFAASATVAVEEQFRDGEEKPTADESSDPSAHDSVFAAIATESVWAAGLLEEWPLPREAAWVIVGAVTVSEFVRTKRSAPRRSLPADYEQLSER